MKLRTAINSQCDFEAFMRLHEDLDATQVYIWEAPKEPITEEQKKEADRYFEGFDWDILKYTRSEFEYDTSHKNIVLVEADGKVIGSLEIYIHTRKRYKFADWNIAREYQYLKEEMWEQFLSFFQKTHKGTQELYICLPSTEKVVNWFTQHGFVDTGGHFYSLHLKSHNEGST